MSADFEAYFRDLAEAPLDDKTEQTDRGELKTLLRDFAKAVEPRLLVQHEPKRDKGGGGSPDYMVKRDARVVGYVEVKPIDAPLSKILKGEQIKKYQKLSDNLLLTDYLEFVWLRKGQDPQRARLAHSEELSARKLALKPENVLQVRKLLSAFFSEAPQNIGRGQTLAVELATRAALLRDFLTEELIRQQKEGDLGKLHGLYAAFRDQIFHDLDIKAFADAFAQMLAYGLFLARLNAGAGVEVTLDNVRRFIPGSFSLIRELVRFLEEMDEPEYRPSRWVVDEILSIVNGIDLAAIHGDLSFRQRRSALTNLDGRNEEERRLFAKDPFIYFYEDFLQAYDPEMRESRGVYYTPPPVVNFIVRAIDDILKDTFGITDGLADHKRVTVLDFATGTGTFLLEVFERVFDTIGGPESGRADGIVREHLTKNIYGFEYLIAPYTIAHLKLSQYLRDKGHPLQDKERLQVFLTNTLEPVEPQQNLWMPALADEVKGAQAVKDKPILVITGNPPYSGHSKNKGPWISAAIDGYKYTVETDEGGKESIKALGERNPKWLNDDYVKFIRFAQMKMDGGKFEYKDDRGVSHLVDLPGVDEGVVGIITNHSWLDNPTFRGMRQSLARSFDQIYIIDLHGSTKPKERSPDGSLDGNVFDIQKGVAILILIKNSSLQKAVLYKDVWGSRIHKYEWAAGQRLGHIGFDSIESFEPYFLMRPFCWDGWEDYSTGWQISDVIHGDDAKKQIFNVGVLGFQTHRDDFAISFSKHEAQTKLKVARDDEVLDSDFCKKFGIKPDSPWISRLRASARAGDPLVSRVAYRPFDERWAEVGPVTMDRPRDELVEHVVGRPVLCLLVPRQIGTPDWRHVGVSIHPAESCWIASDSKSQNSVFPLKLSSSAENLSPAFRDFLDARYGEHYDPEQILGYIYAVLHAPTYRTRYAEFLRIDFPRIPFAETPDRFEALSALGWQLIQAHLLKTISRSAPRLGDYVGKGDHTVETVRYSPQEATVWINQTQGFANLPQAVWDFHIGGYQVIDKYLKSRKGRVLNLDEQTHVGNVAEALNFTIAQMQRIDAEYLKAFPAG